MSYITLTVRYSDVIILNAHAPNEDKGDEMKDSFHEELERVLDQFLKYHKKILLGDFNAKLRREDIFEPKNLE
jgi:exonuclease III